MGNTLNLNALNLVAERLSTFYILSKKSFQDREEDEVLQTLSDLGDELVSELQTEESVGNDCFVTVLYVVGP